jgi:hypothetical protein
MALKTNLEYMYIPTYSEKSNNFAQLYTVQINKYIYSTRINQKLEGNLLICYTKKDKILCINFQPIPLTCPYTSYTDPHTA